MKWDIFCSVVDNYGDIGVTWRLARQLVAEHGARVRLWVDDLGAFAHLCPALDPALAWQRQDGVEVGRWAATWPATEPADVVIEAFACQLPASYIEAMRGCERPVLWLNLEYLSAEDWVAGCHALPSPQAGGQQKFFFFPGFTEGTGGLLREADLLSQRDAFQTDAGLQQVFLGSLGVARRPGARLISLFAYENAALASWLDALRDDDRPTQLLVPQGRILADVQTWVGGDPLVVGECRERGSVQVHVLPFLPQQDYDRLLWCCDLNAVRGEDSFVRAQWAGRPLLWHIYQQEEGAHFDKLEAFLALYRQRLSPAAGDALVAFWSAWNSSGAVLEPWKGVMRHWDELAAHAERWCAEQAARPNLAAALVQFYRNWL